MIVSPAPVSRRSWFETAQPANGTMTEKASQYLIAFNAVSPNGHGPIAKRRMNYTGAESVPLVISRSGGAMLCM